MRALFLGTPGRFSARALWAWLAAGNEVCEFWYAHNTRTGAWRWDRRLGLVAPSWSVAAALRRFRVASRPVAPLRRSPELWDIATDLGADVLISAEFPYVVPSAMLDRFGPQAVNLHPALLPDYRGPYPVAGMLFHDEVQRCGGVTLHVMLPELDTGPIIAQRPVTWPAKGGFRQWELQLGQAAGSLVAIDLHEYLGGHLTAKPQLGEGLYFRQLTPEQQLLHAGLTAHRTRHLLDTIGGFLPLQVDVGQRLLKVAGFDQIVGPRTFASPAVGPRRINLDVADARVSLYRWQPWTSRLRRWEMLRVFASAPPMWCEARRVA